MTFWLLKYILGAAKLAIWKTRIMKEKWLHVHWKLNFTWLEYRIMFNRIIDNERIYIYTRVCVCVYVYMLLLHILHIYGFVSCKHNLSPHKMLTDGLEWCGLLWYFLSAVWTLILTAPIYCRGYIGEQMMQCYIFQIYSHEEVNSFLPSFILLKTWSFAHQGCIY